MWSTIPIETTPDGEEEVSVIAKEALTMTSADKRRWTMNSIRHLYQDRQKERTAMSQVRRISLVVVALMVALIAVPRPASAARLIPFQATVTESGFTPTLCAPVPSLCITLTGTGEATQMGEIEESAFVKNNLASNPAPGCHTETRGTTLTAANGDQITMHATGINCSTGPTTVTAVDSYVVTGGTGRFSGASGSGTNTASINLANSTAVVTYSGTLSSPGSLQ